MWSGWTVLGAQRNIYLVEAALLINASPYMRVTETCERTERWEDKRLCIHHTVDREVEKGRRGAKECLTLKKVGEKVTKCVLSCLFLIQKNNNMSLRNSPKGRHVGSAQAALKVLGLLSPPSPTAGWLVGRFDLSQEVVSSSLLCSVKSDGIMSVSHHLCLRRRYEKKKKKVVFWIFFFLSGSACHVSA